MSAVAIRTVPCPACRGDAVFAPGNRWRPFCGPRCAGVDLGAWSSEEFRLPSRDQAGEGTESAGDAGKDLSGH